MIDLEPDLLRRAFGLGVAGNFAGHLEQAGEARDFTGVAAAPDAPKGIFPWYAPGAATFLGTFPVSSTELRRPPGDVRLQIEPEVGLVCDVRYDDAGEVAALAPRWLGAFDDCSVRREGARRISEKKNWGASSKGLATRGFAVADLSPDGPTATFRLACFLRRDGETHAYGVDSPLPGYTYYGARLLDWIAGRLRDQRGADGTPLEDVGALLREAGSPATAVIGIGATRYTALGETTFLEVGDEAIVIVYDGARTSADHVGAAVAAGDEDALAEASLLRQTVVPA